MTNNYLENTLPLNIKNNNCDKKDRIFSDKHNLPQRNHQNQWV